MARAPGMMSAWQTLTAMAMMRSWSPCGESPRSKVCPHHADTQTFNFVGLLIGVPFPLWPFVWG